MSCGKGSALLKPCRKDFGLILLLNYLSITETNDKESVGFLSVAALMVLSVKMIFECRSLLTLDNINEGDIGGLEFDIDLS